MVRVAVRRLCEFRTSREGKRGGGCRPRGVGTGVRDDSLRLREAGAGRDRREAGVVEEDSPIGKEKARSRRGGCRQRGARGVEDKSVQWWLWWRPAQLEVWDLVRWWEKLEVGSPGGVGKLLKVEEWPESH